MAIHLSAYAAGARGVRNPGRHFLHRAAALYRTLRHAGWRTGVPTPSSTWDWRYRVHVSAASATNRVCPSLHETLCTGHRLVALLRLIWHVCNVTP